MYSRKAAGEKYRHDAAQIKQMAVTADDHCL